MVAGTGTAAAQPAPASAAPPSTITNPPRDFGPGGAPTTYFWDPDIIAVDPQMSADVLDEVIRKAGKGLQHRSQPAAVNLTIGTERGTAYPVREIARITEVARRHGLLVHIDGARLANALVALGTSAQSVTTDVGVDVLSFGATKNGTLNTDAIIAFREEIAEQLHYRLRRAGQV